MLNTSELPCRRLSYGGDKQVHSDQSTAEVVVTFGVVMHPT